METNCEFMLYPVYYTCYVKDTVISKKDQVIEVFKGIHRGGRNNEDVQNVCFLNGEKIYYLPQGLYKHFPDMFSLIIRSSGIKQISKNDLVGLENLQFLLIEKSELTSLPDDLFSSMPKLKSVSFNGNKIEFASSKLLEPLLGRKNVEVDLRGNKSIDACFWPTEDSSLKSLSELLKLIDEKCTKPKSKPNAELEQTISEIKKINLSPEPVEVNPTIDHGLKIDIKQLDFISQVKTLWQSGKFSDFTIIVHDKKFKVHKNILGTRSAVFAQIFEDKSEANEMKITEISSRSVEALLHFIYTDEIRVDDNVKESFEIAAKFKVDLMKYNCEKIICDQLNNLNAWELFLFAHQNSSQQIKEKSFKFIGESVPFDLPEKLMEDPENLKTLLDSLQIVDKILANASNNST